MNVLLDGLLSLRNRFSKEKARKIPSGSAMQTEWPLMKYLTFLHSMVKKRRTFENIAIEDESNSPSETQDCDNLCEDNAKGLTAEDDSMQFIDYEYLDSNETGISKITLSYYSYIVSNVKY